MLKGFWNRKAKSVPDHPVNEVEVEVENVWVVKTIMILSRNDGKGCGPESVVEWYFLAKIKDGEYYEFFSGKKLEEEIRNDMRIKILDTPYIKETKPLKEYSGDFEKKVGFQDLFEFITRVNIWNTQGLLKKD